MGDREWVAPLCRDGEWGDGDAHLETVLTSGMLCPGVPGCVCRARAVSTLGRCPRDGCRTEGCPVNLYGANGVPCNRMAASSLCPHLSLCG